MNALERMLDDIKPPASESESNHAIFAVVREMAHTLIQFRKDLTDHMRDEHLATSQILERLNTVDDIVNSLPLDARGKPDYFKHRTHHSRIDDDVSAEHIINRKYLGMHSTEIRQYIILAVIVMITSGHGELVFQLIAKALKS